jgi:hypothetical protein
MEPTPAPRGSRLSVLLAVAGLVALLLAGLLFWQLWKVRNNPGTTVVPANIATTAPPQIIPPTAATPVSKSGSGVPPLTRVIPSSTVTSASAPVASAAPANPAPAPVIVAAPPVVPADLKYEISNLKSQPPIAAPPATPPVRPSSVTADNHTAWPVELKLSAIFFSKTNPRVLINGNLYGTGDEIQGVVLDKIERDQVTVEWNGHRKVLMLGGQ